MDDGVDCEIEEVQKKPANEDSRFEKDLSSKEVMALSSDDLHKASDKHHPHRQHHHHRNDQRKQRYSDTDSNYLSDLDRRNSNGHLKKHTHNQVEANHDPSVTNKNSSRAHHSRGSTQQQSKQNAKDYTEEEPLAKSSTIIGKDKRDLHSKSVEWSESGETEEGEILEDGELEDDKEATEKQEMFAVKDHIEVSESKSSNKKGVKRERKKSGNRSKRNRETDMKRRKHNYADDDDKFQDEKKPGPTWGSGYQTSSRRVPVFSSMKQGYGRGSPPGLYDSPSGGSDEELVSKTLMTGAYIDASVAADEKQGIFDRKVNMGKRKKQKCERKENKRGQNGRGSFEGPPKKKSLLDMKMSERPACKFYIEGKCAKAGMCPFNHNVEKTKRMEVCKYHLTVKGCHKDSCQFMHNFPCKYYHTGAKCFSGDTCKFSHDPLTEGTRKALEMRVAADDIIDPEDSSNNEHRLREANNKPSLLGSPPRVGPELRRIPSLFEIEVHPPGQSPKPPPPQTVRPSGFYSETNAACVSGPINNVGLMKSVIASNLNSQQRGGAGLLQLPVRPGNINNGFMGSIMGNQQGLNPGLQRFATGPSVQMKNNQQPQNGHLSPVLNMLGAIIREAATQKGPNSQSSMLPKMSMGANNMSPHLNTVLADVDHSSGGHNRMTSDNIASNTTSLESFNSGFTQGGKAGFNHNANMCQDKDIESNVRLIMNSDTNASSGQQNMVQESCKTDDYTSQRNLDDVEESQDICELNKIRQQIQAQINEEEKKEIAAADGEEQKGRLKGDQLLPEKSGIQEKEDLNSSNTVLEVKSIAIPTHLPKTQQELFKRIQQQHLLREKELGQPKVHADAKENESKDDWYSSDEDEEPKPKLTDVLKKLNQEPSSHTGSSSPLGSHIVNPPEQKIMQSAASTFNIMQMINAIKGRSEVSKPVTVNAETSSQPSKLSLPTDSQGVDTLMSPASPPIVSTSIMKSFGILHNVSNCPPPKLAVDPPVINAIPLKPLNYVAVRLSLEMPRPYAQLFDSVIAADPAFKDDPRVKWHLSHIEKQAPKESQRESSSEEKSQKPSDPRLAKGLNDPRLMKQNDSDGSDRLEGSRSSDPRLHRTEAQSLPTDPRLAHLASGNLDPRLNRQIIQNHQSGGEIFNIRGGGMAGNGRMVGNQVCSFINGPMNNMAAMGSMRSPINNLTGQRGGGMGHFSVDGHKRLVQSNGGSPNMVESMGSNMSMMGRPMNNIGGQINQMHPLNMRGPQESSFGLESRRLMISQENTMEDPVNQPNPLRSEPSPVGPGVNNTSDPRLRRQKVLNEMHDNNDPRLRHRSADPREQRFPVSDSGLFRMSPNSETIGSSSFEGLADHRTSNHTNNFKPFENNLKQREISQSLNFVQSNTVSFNTHELSKISHGREERISATDHKAQGDGLLPCPSSLASFVSDSNAGVSAVQKFDHRSDPRFRRLKRVGGQQKDSVEYSSPLGDDRYAGIPGVHEQCSSGQNSYNRSRSGPSVRGPQLPNTLQDLSLPISPSFSVTESDLKVKDHFKVIGPTASPFC